MGLTLSHRNIRLLVTGFLLATLYALCAVIARSSLFGQAPDLMRLGLTIDLTLTAGLIVYFLAIRPGAAPRVVLLPVISAGLLFASWVTPKDHSALPLLPILLGLFEMAALVFVVWRGFQLHRAFRSSRAQGADLPLALEQAWTSFLGHPRFAAIVATESSLLFYAFFGWFLKEHPQDAQDADPADAPRTFSVGHRKAQWGVTLGVLTFVVLLETFAVHIFVQHWSPIAAWILTALSLYSLLWLFGDYHAMRLNPITLLPEQEALLVRVGLRCRVFVPLGHIKAIENPDASDQDNPAFLNATVLGQPDFVIVLSLPHQANTLFGSQRTVSRIGLAPDHTQLQQILSSSL